MDWWNQSISRCTSENTVAAYNIYRFVYYYTEPLSLSPRLFNKCVCKHEHWLWMRVHHHCVDFTCSVVCSVPVLSDQWIMMTTCAPNYSIIICSLGAISFHFSLYIYIYNSATAQTRCVPQFIYSIYIYIFFVRHESLCLGVIVLYYFIFFCKFPTFVLGFFFFFVSVLDYQCSAIQMINHLCNGTDVESAYIDIYAI